MPLVASGVHRELQDWQHSRGADTRGCIGDEDNSGVPAKTCSVLCGAFSWGGLADRVPGRRAAEHALFSDLLGLGHISS